MRNARGGSEPWATSGAHTPRSPPHSRSRKVLHGTTVIPRSISRVWRSKHTTSARPTRCSSRRARSPPRSPSWTRWLPLTSMATSRLPSAEVVSVTGAPPVCAAVPSSAASCPGRAPKRAPRRTRLEQAHHGLTRTALNLAESTGFARGQAVAAAPCQIEQHLVLHKEPRTEVRAVSRLRVNDSHADEALCAPRIGSTLSDA